MWLQIHKPVSIWPSRTELKRNLVLIILLDIVTIILVLRR